jgi:hypothetical protein
MNFKERRCEVLGWLRIRFTDGFLRVLKRTFASHKRWGTSWSAEGLSAALQEPYIMELF